VLGGWLVQHATWRWVFLINLPIAAAVIAISAWLIPESRSDGAWSVDWPVGLLATIGLGGLVAGFMESVSAGWRHPLVFGGLIVGVVCLVAFVAVEDRSESPMLPLELFDSRSFSGANLLTLFLYGAIGIFFFLFPLNLIQVQGYSATAAGAAVLPLVLLIFVLSRWSGGLVARYGPTGPLVIGPLIAALGFALFALPSVGASYWKAFLPAVVVLGFGMAVTVAPLTTVVMNSVNQSRVGAASGINNAVARIAGVLAIAILGIVMMKVFGSRLNHDLAKLSLPPTAMRQLHADETKLADLQAPASLDPQTKTAIAEFIKQAFVSGFRVVMWICASLSLVSATVAGLTVRKDRGPNRLMGSTDHKQQNRR
jgi:predicted MFS family arabinose efflux permease